MDDRHFGYITKLRKKKKKKKENPVTKASASSVSLRNVDCGVVWKKVTIIERRELWCRICSCLLPSLISALALSLSRSSLTTPLVILCSLALFFFTSFCLESTSKHHNSMLTLRWERATQISGMRSCYLGFEFFLRVFFSLLFRFFFLQNSSSDASF